MSTKISNPTFPAHHPTQKNVPPCYASSPQIDSTNYCSATIVACNQPSHVSNITTTNQIDTDINNDDYTQYVSTLIKHNHSTPKI